MKTELSVLLALSSAVAACGGTNELHTPVILGVSSVDAPAAIAVGARLEITLNVQVGGCLAFDHIEANRNASSATIIVWGRDITEGITDRGILCTRILDEPHQYSFDPPFASPFTIQVLRGRIGPLITKVDVR